MKPARYFVRTWTVDPTGEGPDAETNFAVDSEAEARALAKKWRRKGENAGAFERRNIHVPDDIPIPDPPAQFWEYDEVQIDEETMIRFTKTDEMSIKVANALLKAVKEHGAPNTFSFSELVGARDAMCAGKAVRATWGAFVRNVQSRLPDEYAAMGVDLDNGRLRVK